MFQKILVAIDRSDISSKAFDTAVSLAKAINAHLKLVHIIAPYEEMYPDPVSSIDRVDPGLSMEDFQIHWETWQLMEQQGLQFIKSRAAEATAAGIPTEYTQSFGNPGHVICVLAEEWQANLIVIGRRERSGLGEFFLGSISNYVFHHAPCSLLTVHNETESTESTDR
jgi:nucleotide-binding universal stress UspA family protein